MSTRWVERKIKSFSDVAERANDEIETRMILFVNSQESAKKNIIKAADRRESKFIGIEEIGR